MQVIWVLLDIAFFGLILVILVAIIGGMIDARKNKKNGVVPPREPVRPIWIEQQCPFCGGNASKLYYPDDANSSRSMFTCSDCYKSFGDPAQLTAEEKQIIDAQVEACMRAEQIPELNIIITDVYELARRKSNFVSIHGGKVYTTRYNEGDTCLCTYDPTLGKVGDQHIAFLCMEYIQENLGSLGIKVWLMEHGVAWEWPKN